MTANPAAGDLFGGSLALSIAGAVWVWLLALTLGAALLPAPNHLHDGSRLLVWPVVGFAVQTQVWLILGLFDQLWSPVVVGVAIGLTTVAGLLAGPRIARELRATLVTGRSAGAAGPGGPHWIRIVAWGSVTVFIALVLRFSFWPTVFYDDLVYHLGIPRQALLTGSWPAMPGLHYSFMPAGWDAAYVLPMSLGGGSGPQLMNVIALAAFTWSAYRLARLGGGADAAAVVVTLLVITPMTGSLGAFAGNDLFVALALSVAAERLVATDGRRPRLVGLLAGAAWAAKYSALPACAGLALAAGWSRTDRPGKRLAAAAWVGVGTVAVGLLWNVRSWVLTGNPLYPAFFGLLGGRYWSETSAVAVAAEVSHGGLADRGPLAFVLALRDLVLHSDMLGNPSGVNVLYVLLALAGTLLYRRVRGGTTLLLIAAVSYVGWCVTSLNLRYALFMLAVLAPFATAVVELGARRLERVVPRRAAVAALCTLLIIAVLGPFLLTVERHMRLYGEGTRLFGGTPRTELHASRLHLGQVGRDLASRLPEEARILLIGEGRVGLLPRPTIASSAYDQPDIARYVDGLVSVRELNRRLGEFTHVVVNFRELERFKTDYGFTERFGPQGWQLFNDWLANGLIPFVRFGNVVVYRIPDEEMP